MALSLSDRKKKTYTLGSVWLSSATGGKQYRWAARAKGLLCPDSDTKPSKRQLVIRCIVASVKFNYSVVDEFHIDVDSPNAWYKESNSNGRFVEQLTVQSAQCVFSFLPLREFDQSPVLWCTTFQCNLNSVEEKSRE